MHLFSAAGTGELLHCEKSINTLEYRRILQKACFPQLISCFLKQNNQILFFNKTIVLPTLQRPPKRGSAFTVLIADLIGYAQLIPLAVFENFKLSNFYYCFWLWADILSSCVLSLLSLWYAVLLNGISPNKSSCTLVWPAFDVPKQNISLPVVL